MYTVLVPKHDFKHCSRIMKLNSNILLGLNVIVAMVKMEITTHSVHCTGNIGSLQIMQYKNELQK